jgi:hypothetical protein
MDEDQNIYTQFTAKRISANSPEERDVPFRPVFCKLQQSTRFFNTIDQQQSSSSTMPRKAPTPLKVKKNILSDVVSKT